MADTGIFTNQAGMLKYAGSHVSTTLNAATDTTFAYSNLFIREAESYINVAAGYNFSDNYSTLNADVKYILEQTAAAHAAISCVNYDPTTYTSNEAQFKVDMMTAIIAQNIALLKDYNNKVTFINGA